MRLEPGGQHHFPVTILSGQPPPSRIHYSEFPEPSLTESPAGRQVFKHEPLRGVADLNHNIRSPSADSHLLSHALATQIATIDTPF